nr:envelope stress response membrane protein PspB [uncultured Lichenicoccus sp.]
MIDSLVPLVSVLAPFLLVFFIIRMRHERRMREMNQQGLSQEEQRVLADMGETARRMEQRIENLERILDSELAGWRSRMSL